MLKADPSCLLGPVLSEASSAPGFAPADPIPEAVARVFGADAFNALVCDPNFPAAMRAAAAYGVRNYDGNWLRNRLLNDRGRFLAALMILDLHFTEGGGAGVTGARLRREVSAYGVCSEGRITAFLAGLRFAKFLTLRTSADQRERRLVPTPAFLDTHRERWRGMFSAIALMRPQQAARAIALPDALLFGPCIHAMVTCFRQGFRVFDVSPTLRPYAERDAGLTMLVSLLAASDQDEAISVSQFSTQFLISRAHVSAVMRQAEADGLARGGGPRGGYRAGPRLEQALTCFYGSVFLTFLKALEAAESATEGSVRPAGST